jgi:hypothetical protein
MRASYSAASPSASTGSSTSSNRRQQAPPLPPMHPSHRYTQQSSDNTERAGGVAGRGLPGAGVSGGSRQNGPPSKFRVQLKEMTVRPLSSFHLLVVKLFSRFLILNISPPISSVGYAGRRRANPRRIPSSERRSRLCDLLVFSPFVSFPLLCVSHLD